MMTTTTTTTTMAKPRRISPAILLILLAPDTSRFVPASASAFAPSASRRPFVVGGGVGAAVLPRPRRSGRSAAAAAGFLGATSTTSSSSSSSSSLSSSRSSSDSVLREWFISEIGSLDSSPPADSSSSSSDGGGGAPAKFLDSPAATADGEGHRIVGRRGGGGGASGSSTRREWFGASAAAAAAALAGASSAWSVRPESALAEEGATTTTAAAVAASSTVAPAASAALCDPSVSTFRNPATGRIVHLLGTAHISSDSALLAGRVVREVRPDAVFVELDRKRIARALPTAAEGDGPSGGPGAGEKISVGLSARGGGSVGAAEGDGSPAEDRPQEEQRTPRFNPILRTKERVLSASTRVVGEAIRGMYSKLNEQGFSPGEEFVLAIQEAMNINAAVVLGDRDVDVTLRRLTEALSKTDLKKLLSSDSELEQSLRNVMPDDLRASMAGVDAAKLTKDQLSAYVETVKARENVRVVMSQLEIYAPELYRAMVAERDEYMARGLDSLDRYGTTVAVMGIAHVDGVEGGLRERGWVPVSVPCPVG